MTRLNLLTKATLLVALALAAWAQQPDFSDRAAVAELHAHGRRFERSHSIVWVDRDATQSLSDREANEFATRVDRGIAEIERFTNIPFRDVQKHFGADKVEYFVTDRSATPISHADDRHPYIFLSSMRTKDDSAPYLHETAHLFLWDADHAFWLFEGLPEYIERRVGARSGNVIADPFNPNNEDINLLAARDLDSPAEEIVLPLVGDNGPDFDHPWNESPERRSVMRRIDTERRTVATPFYRLSHSFITYLVEKNGLPKIIRAARSDDPKASIETLTGKPVTKWKAEWIAWLRSLR